MNADLVQNSLLDGSSERLQTLHRVAEYCGKPLLPDNDTFNASTTDATYTWDFYNSFFVAVTIVSTIGKNKNMLSNKTKKKIIINALSTANKRESK